MDFWIKAIVLAVSLFVFFSILSLYRQTRHANESRSKKWPLLLTGFVANVADTLGLGSFAVVVACNHRWKFVDDKQLPGTLNAHSVLPAMLQSILFLNFVEMDMALLLAFVAAACVGGIFSGLLVSKLDKQTIRILMVAGFSVIGLLIAANQLDLLPVGGEATTLPLNRYWIGIPAMVLAGMLPGIGAGLYVPIQVILFLLGLSPLVAFPIMTTAGAIVQSLTAYTFVVKKEVAVKESLWLTLSGMVGVAIAVPLVTYVNLTTLRWLLVGIVFYNAWMMWKTYRQEEAKVVSVTA